MVRQTILAALMLCILCLPLQAESARRVPATPPAPQVQIAVTFALITNADVKASRVSSRIVPIDQVVPSPQPWGRSKHLDLQVIPAKSALRLLAALAKSQRLGETTTNIIPSDGQDRVVHFQQISMVDVSQSIDGFQETSTTPSQPDQPVMLPYRFFLSPRVNADGTVSLSFAPSLLASKPSVSPTNMSLSSNISAEELNDKGVSFNSLGTVHSGETIALSGLAEGPQFSGVELVAFVTPTIIYEHSHPFVRGWY